MAATYTHVLVLDFDGTVCLGDGPVFAYARLLDEALQAQPGYAGECGLVLGAVERFLGDTSGGASGAPETDAERDADATVAGSVDGYEAAERLARRLGATDAQLSAAYAGSREELASGEVETHAPAGLADLLLGLPETTQVVLVTNAPENGVTQQLRHLGLAECFGEVVTSAGKPAGMAPIVARLLAQNELGAEPSRLLSVGDIWRNDLAPAATLGCETALIERLPGPADARPTYRAPTIEQLYPAIAAWAARP